MISAKHVRGKYAGKYGIYHAHKHTSGNILRGLQKVLRSIDQYFNNEDEDCIRLGLNMYLYNSDRISVLVTVIF